MSASKTLTELREDIDAIDGRLVQLISQRARIAQKIGRMKNDGARAVLDTGREREVLETVRANNPGPLAGEAIDGIFREIISACRAAQQPISVAFLGPEGTFSHAAAIRQFGHAAEFQGVKAIADVFAAVESGRARYGVVPIENTTEGAVTPTLDALADTSLRIVAELTIKIDHCLLARDENPAVVRRIVSHPQPLAQCRRYLAETFPRIEPEAATSTAAAARMAASQRGTAAVASELAAEIYGLHVVARRIQDEPGNVTRFIVIGSDPLMKASGRDRTSLVILVRDEVGVLGRILSPFTENKVNLSMIESRPLAGRPWEYRFFVDVSGHCSDRRVARALAAIERIAISTKVLGSYPVAS